MFLWTYVFIPLWVNTENWKCWSYGKCMVNFMRKCSTLFQNGCAVLYFYQQCMSFGCFTVHTRWYLDMSIFLILAILVKCVLVSHYSFTFDFVVDWCYWNFLHVFCHHFFSCSTILTFFWRLFVFSFWVFLYSRCKSFIKHMY